MRLSREARATIRDYFPGVTIAGYMRHYSGTDGVWYGDACGCTDDRCKDGYHHDPNEECGCLPVCLEQYYLEALAPSWFVLVLSGDGRVEWLGPLGTGQHEIGQWLGRGDAEYSAANWERQGYTVTVEQRHR